jgi:hypothetical protein
VAMNRADALAAPAVDILAKRLHGLPLPGRSPGGWPQA